MQEAKAANNARAKKAYFSSSESDEEINEYSLGVEDHLNSMFDKHLASKKPTKVEIQNDGLKEGEGDSMLPEDEIKSKEVVELERKLQEAHEVIAN